MTDISETDFSRTATATERPAVTLLREVRPLLIELRVSHLARMENDSEVERHRLVFRDLQVARVRVDGLVVVMQSERVGAHQAIIADVPVRRILRIAGM